MTAATASRGARVLVAPDKFKGSVSAAEAAAALARGLARGGAEAVSRPVADGGEGTLDVLRDVGFVVHEVASTDAFGRPVTCRLGVRGATAVVEMADVCRRPVRPTPGDAMGATTAGLAAPLRAVRDHGCDQVVVAVGGSASTDGGAGLMRGLGARLLRRDGSEVTGVGGGLAEVDRIDLHGVPPDLPRLLFAVDVASPLLGPTGAAQMFAPQKGARAEDVEVLERALTRLASAVRSGKGTDLSTMPGTGAGGGVAFLPAALLGGDVVPGAELVLDLLGVDALLDEVDAVVTGEGSWDAQTAQGKAPEAVRRRAVSRGVRVAVVAGQVDRAHLPADVVAAVSLSERAGGTAVAVARATELLEEVGRDLARSLSRGVGGTAAAAPSG